MRNKLAKQCSTWCAVSLFVCAREGPAGQERNKWLADGKVRMRFCAIALMPRYRKTAYWEETPKALPTAGLLDPECLCSFFGTIVVKRITQLT